jgi:hypothetical protein
MGCIRKKRCRMQNQWHSVFCSYINDHLSAALGIRHEHFLKKGKIG